MAGSQGQQEPLKPGAKRNPVRNPLPKPRLPGQQQQQQGGMPGLGGTVKPRVVPGQQPPNLPASRRGPVPAQKPAQKPSQAPTQQRQSPRKPSAPVQAPDANGAPTKPASPARRGPSTGRQQSAAPAKPQRKEPTNIEELIPVLVRHAVRREDGLTIAMFDEKFLPRVNAMVPDNLERMRKEIVSEYLTDIAHALYIAVVVGQFANRPVLCGVRGAELAADLLERVLSACEGREDRRLTVIRASNMLVGLTFNSVRLLETTSFSSQPMQNFTDNFERAVITTYGLKTQAEATGQAPWVGQKANPLDKRIGRAINTMSNVFGEYIGRNGETMDDSQYDEVLREFDGFMERFAPYIEGGRTGAEERRKKLARDSGDRREGPKVEPLTINELRTRPAGVEIILADGRHLFVSSADARRIGQAADGEVDDTGKRTREEIESRSGN